MTKRLAVRGLALLCDSAGIIQEIIRDDFGLTAPQAVGRSFTELLAAAESEATGRFWTALREQRTIFDWPLAVALEAERQTWHWAGEVWSEQSLIIGAPAATTLAQIYEALLQSDHDWAQALRTVLVARAIKRGNGESSLLAEVSRLNSELVTLQREVVKQNQALAQAKSELEQRVAERTIELRHSNEQLATELLEHRRTEAALRESERRLQLAQKIASIASWEWDIRTNQVKWSKDSAALYGLTPAEFNLDYNQWRQRIYPADREWLEQAINRTVEEGAEYDVEFRVVWPDGSIHWLAGRGEVLRDEQGQPVRMLGINMEITQRRLAQEQILQEKRFSESLIRSLPGIFYLFGETGRFLRWNRNLETVTGYTASELSQMTPLEMTPPGEHAFISEQIQHGFTKGETAAETVLVTKTGQQIPYYFTGVKYELDGQPYLLGMGLDLNKLKQAESERDLLLVAERAARAEAETAKQQITSIIERVTDAFVALDTDWRYTYVNERAAQIFQRRREDLIGKHIWTEFPEGVGQPFYRAYYEAVATQIPRFIEEFYPPWGRWFMNRIYPSPDGVSIFFQDITERKQMEEALRTSSERYRRIVETAREGIWLLDAEAKTTYVNQRLAELLGYTPGEMLGQSAFDFLDKSVRPEVRRAFARPQAGPIEQRDLRFRRKDGSYLWAIVSASPVFDETGRFIGGLGMITDITERKRVEEQLRVSSDQLHSLAAHLQLVREEERAQIAREIHDEFGQALTGLKMDLSWLAGKLPAEPPTFLDKIRGMIKLVDATIQLVRKVATELRPGILDDLGLVAAIEWQAQEFEARTGIQCQIESAVEELELDQTSTTAIFRVFQETLTNVARHAQATRVSVNLEIRADTLSLEVKDNGCGISASDLTSNRSFGVLGMRERALLLGGQFNISSMPGQGTTVRLIIPLDSPRRKPPHFNRTESGP